MNHSNTELKLFWAKLQVMASRVILITLITGMSYVVSRTGYNVAHWIPHRLILQAGVSYDTMLWAEQRIDVLLHFFGGLLLTVFLYSSKIPVLKLSPAQSFFIVCLLSLGAEILQSIIGRGFDWVDLLLGISGGFMAYSVLNKNTKI